MSTKEDLIRDLNFIVDLGSSDNEVYDNLTAILEVLRLHDILDDYCYEEVEAILESYWGFI